MVETTAGVEPTWPPVCPKCEARHLGHDWCTQTRAEQPRPVPRPIAGYPIRPTEATEIRDPILRLFIEEILRQTPNGEWSVLPETGKADVGLRIIFDAPPGPEAGRFVEVETPDGRSINAGEWHQRADGYWELRLAALTTGADGGSRQPAPRADSALEQWKLVRGICNNSPMFSDARGWKRVTVELLSALRQPAPRADDALREGLRQLMLKQPITEGRDTYSDGFFSGLAYAIGSIDRAALASVEPTAAKGD